jgi:hypothetical protein
MGQNDMDIGRYAKYSVKLCIKIDHNCNAGDMPLFAGQSEEDTVT